MLVTIASQAALAIKHLQHVEADILTQKTLIRSLFDDLFANKGGMEESMYRRASFLGCDLTQLHVVVQMEISQVGTEHGREKIMSETERVALNRSIANQLGQRIQLKYPGSLVGERNTTLVSLLRIGENLPLQHVVAWIEHLFQHVKKKQKKYLSGGVWNPCLCTNAY